MELVRTLITNVHDDVAVAATDIRERVKQARRAQRQLLLQQQQGEGEEGGSISVAGSDDPSVKGPPSPAPRTSPQPSRPQRRQSTLSVRTTATAAAAAAAQGRPVWASPAPPVARSLSEATPPPGSPPPRTASRRLSLPDPSAAADPLARCVAGHGSTSPALLQSSLRAWDKVMPPTDTRRRSSAHRARRLSAPVPGPTGRTELPTRAQQLAKGVAVLVAALRCARRPPSRRARSPSPPTGNVQRPGNTAGTGSALCTKGPPRRAGSNAGRSTQLVQLAVPTPATAPVLFEERSSSPRGSPRRHNVRVRSEHENARVQRALAGAAERQVRAQQAARLQADLAAARALAAGEASDETVAAAAAAISANTVVLPRAWLKKWSNFICSADSQPAGARKRGGKGKKAEAGDAPLGNDAHASLGPRRISRARSRVLEMDEFVKRGRKLAERGAHEWQAVVAKAAREESDAAPERAEGAAAAVDAGDDAPGGDAAHGHGAHARGGGGSGGRHAHGVPHRPSQRGLRGRGAPGPATRPGRPHRLVQSSRGQGPARPARTVSLRSART